MTTLIYIVFHINLFYAKYLSQKPQTTSTKRASPTYQAPLRTHSMRHPIILGSPQLSRLTPDVTLSPYLRYLTLSTNSAIRISAGVYVAD